MIPNLTKSLVHSTAGALVAFLCLAGVQPAWSQGFMVKPMRVEVSPAAGRLVDIPIEIQNTAGDGPRAIDLRFVELSQTSEGTWQIAEPGAGEAARAEHSSLGWSSITSSSIVIDPMAATTFNVTMNVPPEARGSYFAGLIAETPLPPDTRGIVVRVRFLIPLIVEISGRPVRQQVKLADTRLTRIDPAGLAMGSTRASLLVTNEGRTFSRVKGRITVETRYGEQWRVVTRFDLPERSIIPGVTLDLGNDLERRLPSGEYRVKAELSVDGRRLPQLMKETAFEGDPAADAIAFDTALVLSPQTMSIPVLPGATRATTLSISNPGENSVSVTMEASTPSSMIGVQLGSVKGTDMSAQPWTEIRPAQFQLRAGARQNVRVISRIPDEGAQFPNYYASLVLKGTYTDGQSAGETNSTLHLSNSQGSSVVDASISQLLISEGTSPTNFIIQSRLANTGNVHIQPVARVFVVNPQGQQVSAASLEGEEGMILPLGTRSYSAELDLSTLEAGYYAVRISYLLEGGLELVKQQVLHVEMLGLEGPDGDAMTVPSITFSEGSEFPDTNTTGDADDAPKSDRTLEN